MNRNKRVLITDELGYHNYEQRGERLSALVELGPGNWFVRSLDYPDGNLKDVPAQEWWNDHYDDDDTPVSVEQQEREAANMQDRGEQADEQLGLGYSALPEPDEGEAVDRAVVDQLMDSIEDAVEINLLAEDETSYKFSVRLRGDGSVTTGIFYKATDGSPADFELADY